MICRLWYVHYVDWEVLSDPNHYSFAVFFLLLLLWLLLLFVWESGSWQPRRDFLTISCQAWPLLLVGNFQHTRERSLLISGFIQCRNTRAKRLRIGKVSIFKLAVANANFTTRMPVFELKSNFISIQNFKAGNVKPPGMPWSEDF